eukprot:GHVL01039186.1.p1 GENE.GHVL01039186.1~~GHVL01039186.1.p1  ORF type:complete len:108 (+),score=13.65 GHVL01039186.1:222-545(+)
MFLPALADHLRAESIDATMYASQWFITIFTYSFSFSAVVRIWDIFLLEGFEICYRAALAVMKLNEEALLQEDFEAILLRLKNSPLTISAETLIRTSLSINLTSPQED